MSKETKDWLSDDTGTVSGEDKTKEELQAELQALQAEVKRLKETQAEESATQETAEESEQVWEALEDADEDIEIKAETLCRWGAARAGAIVIAPVVGTAALMANEVYMVSRIARLYHVKLTERALMGFVGALISRVAGHLLTTLIPFSVIQVPVAVGITYSLGRVTQRWLQDGMPEDMQPYMKMMDEWKDKARDQVEKLKDHPLKNLPLGDETIDFMKRWGRLAVEKWQVVKEKGQDIYHSVTHYDDLVDEILAEEQKKKAAAASADTETEETDGHSAASATDAAADREAAPAPDGKDSGATLAEEQVAAAIANAKLPLDDN